MIRQGHNTQTLIPSVGDVSKRRVLSLLNCAECRAARAVRFEAIQPGCIWNSTAAENGARVVSRPAVRHSRAAFCIRKYYQRPASAGVRQSRRLSARATICQPKMTGRPAAANRPPVCSLAGAWTPSINRGKGCQQGMKEEGRTRLRRTRRKTVPGLFDQISPLALCVPYFARD